MRLTRTQFALEKVLEFLGDRGKNALMESFCVQYLLVCLYSEMENELADLISSRLKEAADPKVATFIASTQKAMIRRVKKAEINDILSKFGCDERVEGELNGRNLQPYFDAITNRHLVTHGEGSKMTLSEFERALPCAELILDEVERIIDL